MSFFNELKRRNVFRVGIAYTITSWLLIQVADVLFDSIGAPPWVMQAMFVLLVAGLVIALIFAWAFEMTPEGVKREKDVDRNQSIASQTGRKLNNTILVLMALAIAYLLFDKFSGRAQPETDHFSQQASGQTTETNEKSALTPVETIDQAETKEEQTISKQSIAVLPFANRSNSEDDVFFTDGIHDDLLTQLAKIGDLKVISRTSMMKYRGTEKTIPEIASELGVSNILEGGIQRAGKRIRINAQLIDVSTDEHLWAETFDREMTMENIFDIQTEITRQIVTAVKGQLTESDQQSLGHQPTDNLEAYEAYLQAKAAMNDADYSQTKFIRAQPWAERAVKLDPGFAEAWHILMEIHAQAVWLGFDRSPERRKAADLALRTAEQIDPDSAAVKIAQSQYLYRFDFDYAAALEKLNEAQNQAPGNTLIRFFKGMSLRRLGRWEESISEFEAATELDPANEQAAASVVDTLGIMNEWDRVEDLLDEWITEYPGSMDLKGIRVLAKMLNHGDLESARELYDLLQPWQGYVYIDITTRLHRYERNFEPYLPLVDSRPFQRRKQFGDTSNLLKGMTYHMMGNEELSRQHFQQLIDEVTAAEPSDLVVDTFQLKFLAEAWSFMGEHDKALEASRRTMKMIPLENDHIYGAMMAQTYTFVLARAGKRDEALERLAQSLDTPRGRSRWELTLDPRWDFFRDDERFNDLIRPKNLEASNR